MHRARVRAADPPGSGLAKFDTWYRDKICKDVVREDIERIRAKDKAAGVDPIFTPEPKYIDELMGDCDLRLSSADMVAMARGKGPPDGYELVRVEDDK